MTPLIECVPNFSEGRDLRTIKQITDAIEAVDGVKLLDVDPGRATNRTVVTFVGAPDPVVEAAFRAVAQAAEVIDMRQHAGEHPRFGATDVCPFVPVADISMDEVVAYARQLGARIGGELGFPVYLYEHAASRAERRNLAVVRAGEYEGLRDRLSRPDGQPDFGPDTFNAKSGAIAVGARDFLVAYNVNLNTTSTRRANAIAFDVRERGRIARDGDPLTGEIIRDAAGEPTWTPGSLECVKGIGWYIEEYGIAQVSLNLTNLAVTPIHVAFDDVSAKAAARGVRVTGSELVGLVPLQAMLDAGRYFLKKQHRSVGIADSEIIRIAVRSLGLDDLAPFRPDEKIIEYAMAAADRSDEHAPSGPIERGLVGKSVRRFVEETASESVAPGGGSVAAAVGALGAALGTMVANLSSHKRGWDERWEEFSDWAERGKRLHDELLRLVDADTDAFNAVMAAFALPRETEQERTARDAAVEAATKRAIEVPLQVMETALASMEVTGKMADIGLPSSASDAGVGALCARAAVRGASLNVRTNAKDLRDRGYADAALQRAREWEERAAALERETLASLDPKM